MVILILMSNCKYLSVKGDTESLAGRGWGVILKVLLAAQFLSEFTSTEWMDGISVKSFMFCL